MAVQPQVRWEQTRRMWNEAERFRVDGKQASERLDRQGPKTVVLPGTMPRSGRGPTGPAAPGRRTELVPKWGRLPATPQDPGSSHERSYLDLLKRCPVWRSLSGGLGRNQVTPN